MKKVIFILLLTTCVLSCAQTQSLGAGVTVDKQGNLKIDAPLYVIDENPQKPGLKPAPSSMNFSVYAGIPEDDASNPLEVTGGIVKGRLSLTIKKPNEYWLYDASYAWYISEGFFTGGADVKIGELFFSVNNSDGYRRIALYTNYHVKLSTVSEYDYYYIDGDLYEYIYSLGNVTISGKIDESRWYNWHGEFDVRLNRGWNVTRVRYSFDNTLNRDVETRTSALPSANAVWVVLE